MGFSQEADDSFERGLSLVRTHGTEVQQYYASLNQAWTSFDRGWMARAEQGYAAALRDAARIESEVAAADKEIALARARLHAHSRCLASCGAVARMTRLALSTLSCMIFRIASTVTSS